MTRTAPENMTAAGEGWRKRLLELGATEPEADMLAKRLKIGMAAQIDADRLRDALGEIEVRLGALGGPHKGEIADALKIAREALGQS